jgi:hypothetical protein
LKENKPQEIEELFYSKQEMEDYLMGSGDAIVSFGVC